MKKTTTLLTSLASVLLCGNVAFAEGEGEPAASEPAPEPTTEGAPAPEATTEAATPSAGGHISGNFLGGGLTVDKSKIVVGLGLPIGLDPFAAAISADGVGIPGAGAGLWARYGVTDKIDVGASYAFAVEEFEIKGIFLATVGFNALKGSAGGKLDLAARATLGYSVLGERLTPIVVGADLRYRINDKMAIFSGDQLQIGIAEEERSVMNVTVKIKDPTHLRLPVGFAYGVNDKITAHASTNLATIDISDSANVFFGADTIPLSVGALYRVDDKLSAGASLIWGNLKDDAGGVNIGLTARYAL